MDKETLSNYGWIVICVLVLAVMIALATPFGTFVADAVKSTTQGLFDVNQNALNSTGLINNDGQEFESCAHEYEVTGTTANCTTAGTTTYTCKLCGKSYGEETPAQHTFTNNVCENCGLELCEFTIDGIKYQYEKGMTWSQWVESKYNSDGYSIAKIKNILIYESGSVATSGWTGLVNVGRNGYCTSTSGSVCSETSLIISTKYELRNFVDSENKKIYIEE